MSPLLKAALVLVGKTVVRKVGDRMENSKRPVIRNVARFFRGK